MLSVRNLSVGINNGQRSFFPVDRISFKIERQETLALVGESGSGKSMTALALMGLLPAGAVLSGNITFNGQSISDSGLHSFQALRGKHISMIFQEPAAALNPVLTIGSQICDIIRHHHRLTHHLARARALSLFEQAGLNDPEFIFGAYPHQLSGGMAQRCMIAMALSCQPQLMIADEPTTALDVSTQTQILQLIAALQQEYHFALLMISHDLGVVSALADRVAVMQSGKILEQNSTQQLLGNPQNVYTRQLLNAHSELYDLALDGPCEDT